MRVLGIDPGLICTGYGIIELKGQNKTLVLLEAGVIKTTSKEKFTTRIHKIYSGFKEILDVYNPQVIALEELYSHYKHPRTAILMAHARGTVYLAAAEKNIDVVSYPAKRVKKAVAGTGAATKMQMQHVIKEILGLKQVPSPHDVADALALAVTHINAAKRRL
ncbi:MAG: crossover junction endodeoxyribonuclease RuvC [PVC group bacterium]|nr:crossover junction endodeoxyribonuclease RuvC [PVC group bacterium]